MTRECEIECVPYQGNSLLFVYYVTYVTGGAAFVFLWGKVGVALLWKRVIIVPQAGADSLVFVRDGNDCNYTFTLHTPLYHNIQVSR